MLLIGREVSFGGYCIKEPGRTSYAFILTVLKILGVKSNLNKCLKTRAKWMSAKNSVEAELQTVGMIYTENGHPTWVIDKFI